MNNYVEILRFMTEVYRISIYSSIVMKEIDGFQGIEISRGSLPVVRPLSTGIGCSKPMWRSWCSSFELRRFSEPKSTTPTWQTCILMARKHSDFCGENPLKHHTTSVVVLQFRSDDFIFDRSRAVPWIVGLVRQGGADVDAELLVVVPNALQVWQLYSHRFGPQLSSLPAGIVFYIITFRFAHLY